MRYVDDNGLKEFSEGLNKRFQPVLASRSEFNEQVAKEEPGRYIAVTLIKIPRVEELYLCMRTRRKSFWTKLLTSMI